MKTDCKQSLRIEKIRALNCWFSFASAFQLFLAVESSSLFHLCICLISMFPMLL